MDTKSPATSRQPAKKLPEDKGRALWKLAADFAPLPSYTQNIRKIAPESAPLPSYNRTFDSALLPPYNRTVQDFQDLPQTSHIPTQRHVPLLAPRALRAKPAALHIPTNHPTDSSSYPHHVGSPTANGYRTSPSEVLPGAPLFNPRPLFGGPSMQPQGDNPGMSNPPPLVPSALRGTHDSHGQDSRVSHAGHAVNADHAGYASRASRGHVSHAPHASHGNHAYAGNHAGYAHHASHASHATHATYGHHVGHCHATYATKDIRATYASSSTHTIYKPHARKPASNPSYTNQHNSTLSSWSPAAPLTATPGPSAQSFEFSNVTSVTPPSPPLHSTNETAWPRTERQPSAFVAPCASTSAGTRSGYHTPPPQKGTIKCELEADLLDIVKVYGENMRSLLS
eukprot:g64549.t1